MILDPATGNIRYSSAGHPPPTLCHEGNLDLLEFGYPPLGADDVFEYGEAESHMERGDRLVMYTDGILFGTERVGDVLRKYRSSSPQEIVGQLLSAAGGWAHANPTDDIAVIVLERKAS